MMVKQRQNWTMKIEYLMVWEVKKTQNQILTTKVGVTWKKCLTGEVWKGTIKRRATPHTREGGSSKCPFRSQRLSNQSCHHHYHFHRHHYCLHFLLLPWCEVGEWLRRADSNNSWQKNEEEQPQTSEASGREVKFSEVKENKHTLLSWVDFTVRKESSMATDQT